MGDLYKYTKYKSKYLNQIGGKKHHKHKNTHTTIEKSGVDYIEHLSEPWFSLISLGLKTVEGRKNSGKFKDMAVGEIIEWENSDFKHRSVKTKIVSKQIYKTFEEYLLTEGLDKCLPGMKDIEHGLSVYFKYFTKEQEAEFGVVAIRLELF
jgi:ASC-1-like (ASCH) protein